MEIIVWQKKRNLRDQGDLSDP